MSCHAHRTEKRCKPDVQQVRWAPYLRHQRPVGSVLEPHIDGGDALAHPHNLRPKVSKACSGGWPCWACVPERQRPHLSTERQALSQPAATAGRSPLPQPAPCRPATLWTGSLPAKQRQQQAEGQLSKRMKICDANDNTGGRGRPANERHRARMLRHQLSCRSAPCNARHKHQLVRRSNMDSH